MSNLVNERQRMQYLEAMGVDSFAPRWLLPGARAPRLCVLPAATTLAEPTAQAVSRYSGPDGAGAGARSSPVDALLETMSPERTGPRSRQSTLTAGQAVAPQAADLAESTNEKAAFSLAFWRVHPQVMVVDTRQPRRALPTETLLRAIVGSLGLAQTLPRAQIQSWPLAGGGDQGWDAAREMIQAFLEGQLLSQPVRYLVLMGSDAVKAVLNESNGAVTDDSRANVDAFACEAFIAPSLTQLLLEPRRKASLWPLLSPLRSLKDDQ